MFVNTTNKVNSAIKFDFNKGLQEKFTVVDITRNDYDPLKVGSFKVTFFLLFIFDIIFKYRRQKMDKDKLYLKNEDLAFEEAFNDLLSISGEKSEMVNKIKNKYNTKDKSSKPQEKLILNKNNAGFSDILNMAKHNNKVFSQDAWIDPNIEAEKTKMKLLKEQGKGAYDSDVLRERILKRQAEKRQALIREIKYKKPEE
ncbi:hypothetical protein FQR65_LT17174 [Abscondita terminalis]|nr:hypothetical protein FQR65_LT17174 [Abscondita terminalis]